MCWEHQPSHIEFLIQFIYFHQHVHHIHHKMKYKLKLEGCSLMVPTNILHLENIQYILAYNTSLLQYLTLRNQQTQWNWKRANGCKSILIIKLLSYFHWLLLLPTHSCTLLATWSKINNYGIVLNPSLAYKASWCALQCVLTKAACDTIFWTY